MIRKTILSALTITMIAGAAPAKASDYGVEVPPVRHGGKHYNRDAAIAGAVIGLIGAIAGADGGHRARKSYRDCFEKPIKRYDPYYGRRVIVDYKLVCR
ncbi:hypothetical protein [Jiella marina]|uniref:hypothetical protein n=1 Tax=Jiella sp. LLJ827 TaxID=2917712 RepID=UPI0021013336|nr:hypothetical protein [Jiella sp. LLJ827]MCQ0988566.1 hypothetical protein [Jiella sp. LLJ827]